MLTNAMMRLQTMSFAFCGVMAITTSPLSKVEFLDDIFSTRMTSPEGLNVGIMDGPAHCDNASNRKFERATRVMRDDEVRRKKMESTTWESVDKNEILLRSGRYTKCASDLSVETRKHLHSAVDIMCF